MSGSYDGLSLHGGDSVYSHTIFKLKRNFWSNSMVCRDGKCKDLRYVGYHLLGSGLPPFIRFPEQFI